MPIGCYVCWSRVFLPCPTVARVLPTIIITIHLVNYVHVLLGDKTTRNTVSVSTACGNVFVPVRAPAPPYAQGASNLSTVTCSIFTLSSCRCLFRLYSLGTMVLFSSNMTTSADNPPRPLSSWPTPVEAPLSLGSGYALLSSILSMLYSKHFVHRRASIAYYNMHASIAVVRNNVIGTLHLAD